MSLHPRRGITQPRSCLFDHLLSSYFLCSQTANILKYLYIVIRTVRKSTERGRRTVGRRCSWPPSSTCRRWCHCCCRWAPRRRRGTRSSGRWMTGSKSTASKMSKISWITGTFCYAFLIEKFYRALKNSATNVLFPVALFSEVIGKFAATYLDFILVRSVLLRFHQLF